MKILVTGAQGMLGRDVVALARGQRHDVVALDHAALDVTDARGVERRIEDARPDSVINCAAWTDVDGAEAREDEAASVNVEGASNVAAAAERVGAITVYPSTDYVFDGSKDGPYVEADRPAPLNAYGRTKLAGERATASANTGTFVVRTAWLFGPGGPNFVETMLRLASDSDSVNVVRDQVGCPTYTGHLAVGLLRLLEGSEHGVHHVASSGSCSRFELAEEIFRQASVSCEVVATTSKQVRRKAQRPANSALISTRQDPIELPAWQRGIGDYLKARDGVQGREARVS